MTLDLQFKIKQNPYYINYLRTNSYWYKVLSRDPLKFNEFELRAKEFYKIRKGDRITKTLEYIELFQTIMQQLK